MFIIYSAIISFLFILFFKAYFILFKAKKAFVSTASKLYNV